MKYINKGCNIICPSSRIENLKKIYVLLQMMGCESKDIGLLFGST